MAVSEWVIDGAASLINRAVRPEYELRVDFASEADGNKNYVWAITRKRTEHVLAEGCESSLRRVSEQAHELAPQIWKLVAK